MALARQEMQESNAPSMQLPGRGMSAGSSSSSSSASSSGGGSSAAAPVVQDLQVRGAVRRPHIQGPGVLRLFQGRSAGAAKLCPCLLVPTCAGRSASIMQPQLAAGLTSSPTRRAPLSQAIVDDLRAEIASSRAELQQLRMAAQASAELN